MQREESGVAALNPPSPEDLIGLQAAALQATANAVVITDRAGTVIWVNSAFERLTGYTQLEVVGQSTRLLRSGRNPKSLYADMWQCILAGRVWRGELINRRKDGTLYPEEMTITPVQDEHGTITHFIGIQLDISERKQADDRLLKLMERFSLATGVAKIGIWELDLTSNTYQWDDTTFEIYGLRPAASVPYERWAAMICPEDLLLTEKALRKSIDEKGQGYAEFRIVTAEGRTKHILAVGRAVLDKKGDVKRVLGTAQDITVRKDAEANLRRLAAIVEYSEDAIVGESLEGIIQNWNCGAEHMYGYSASEIVGKSIRMLCPEGRGDEIAAFLARIRQGETVERHETVRLRKDGKQIRVALTISPVRDESGQIVAASMIARDITDAKRMEDMFRQAQKMEAVGRLAGGVAHDFNNILSVIIGYSELLQERVGENQQLRDNCEEIGRAARRAAGLTRQLLAFSRQQVLEPVVLNLNTCVSGIEKMLRRLIGEDIKLNIRLAPELGCVKADNGQIQQVLMNLAVNARDAMPSGGELAIETGNVYLDDQYAAGHPPCPKGRYACLTMTDTGIGMDEHTRAHLFEPFFTTKEVGKGTGLGLATVYGVVKQSRGFIWVYSEPGQGSIFKIYLPRVDAFEERPASDTVTADSLAGTETILLVEDDHSLRILGRTVLERSGYVVLEAATGAEALEIAQRHPGDIDLMLTDVIMPEMNGPSLAEGMRTVRPGIRCLYMSGYSGSFGTATGLVPEGAALLQKPFTGTELLRKVRQSFTPQAQG